MDRITRVAILGPVAGILVNLSSYHGKYSLAKMLVSTGGLHMETFQFLCTFDWQKAVSGTEENPILHEKSEKLKQFIKGLDQELITVQEEAQQAVRQFIRCTTYYVRPSCLILNLRSFVLFATQLPSTQDSSRATTGRAISAYRDTFSIVRSVSSAMQ